MPAPALDELREDLAFLEDDLERYRYLIDFGESMPPLTENERVEENRVQGCVSQVWLVPEVKQSGGQVQIVFRGDSDASIVRGLVAVLTALFSGRTPDAILELDADRFLSELGIIGQLTPGRQNGLAAMMSRIHAVARAVHNRVTAS
jgi:cysteine desulfuration protein SufE